MPRPRKGLREPTRRAKPSVSNQPNGRGGLRDLSHELEKVAGVTPVPGRGWHGIRQKASDVYEDYESDERILNDQTGHRSSHTRAATRRRSGRRSGRGPRRPGGGCGRRRSGASGGADTGEGTEGAPENTEEPGEGAAYTPLHTPAPPIVEMRRGWE